MSKVLAELASTALIASAMVLCVVGLSLRTATPAYGQSEAAVCPEGESSVNDHCKGTCTSPKTCGIGRDDKCLCKQQS
jgi:hypothetical protein